MSGLALWLLLGCAGGAEGLFYPRRPFYASVPPLSERLGSPGGQALLRAINAGSPPAQLHRLINDVPMDRYELSLLLRVYWERKGAEPSTSRPSLVRHIFGHLASPHTRLA